MARFEESTALHDPSLPVNIVVLGSHSLLLLPIAHHLPQDQEWVYPPYHKLYMYMLRYIGLSPPTGFADYFPQLEDCAIRLIKAGHLYADDTPVEKMREVSSAGWQLHSNRAFTG